MSTVKVVTASDEQIEKIYKKHLKRVFNVKYTPGRDDNTGFVWCSSSPFGVTHYQSYRDNLGILEWQIRHGNPVYFQFQKGGMRYDVSYPSGKFRERLLEISKKAEKKFWKGAQI
ncbi:MAG: hypothetical protein ACOC1K_06765 [Nanoarchaeota archaeon]